VHIDVKTLKVKDRWPLAPCGTPTALSMDVDATASSSAAAANISASSIPKPQGSLHFPNRRTRGRRCFDASTKLVYLSTATQSFHLPSGFPRQILAGAGTYHREGSKTAGYEPQKQNASTSQHRKRRHASPRLRTALESNFRPQTRNTHGAIGRWPLFFTKSVSFPIACRANPIQKQFLPRPALWHYHVI